MSFPFSYAVVPVVRGKDRSIFLNSFVDAKPVTEIRCAVPAVVVSVSRPTLLTIFCFQIDTFFAVDCEANKKRYQFSLCIFCSFDVKINN